MVAGDTVTSRCAVVTGGAGFIGSHLVERLDAEGWDVRVVDDFSSGSEANLASVAERVAILRGDVRDARLLAQACEGAEVVFHQAAVASVEASMADPVATGSVNVEGTVGVLEAARAAGVRRVVLASSCAVYGDEVTSPAAEDAPPSPRSPYGVHKVCAELHAQLYSRLHGLGTVQLRYFNVYGPRQDPRGDYAAVVPRFIAACLTGDGPQVHGDGGQTRDFVYVEDVVRANLLAAHAADVPRQPLNVASGKETSIATLLERIVELTGFSGQASYSSARPGDLRRSVADTRAAAEFLGFEPVVGLEEGLRRTVEAFRRQAGGIAA
jgi:UDP-glucose 4-epimerase